MVQKSLLTLVSLLVLSLGNVLNAKEYVVSSPDKAIQMKLVVEENISYDVMYHGKTLMKQNQIALELSNGILGQSPVVKKVKQKAFQEHVDCFNYRCPSFDVSYNEMYVTFKGDYALAFRVYNDGVAYRWETKMKEDIVVRNEQADFNWAEDYVVYLPFTTSNKDPYAMAFQNIYTVSKISEADNSKVAFLPVTADCGDGVKVTILESDLENYPGMFVLADPNARALKADFAEYPEEYAVNSTRAMKYVTKRSDDIARCQGTRSFPWRIMAITSDDTQMPVNNLVYALASPNRIGDYSWVKSGKVAWDWWNDWGIWNVDFKAGINMDTYKHYIDFAAENQIGYVVLDEGWYNPKSGDMLTVIPELNLEELIAYGKSKGVDLILWTVFNVLDDQLEEACKKYSEMGISGFKVDFLDRDDQTGVEMVYRIAEMTAKYHLTLDLHGIYKPTGLNRTFPNIINFESVFGMEEMKWSTVEKDMMEYDVTMPFIRMMCGPIDYTPGAMRNATKKDFQPIYYNPMSQGTRCHQLATYIVHDSPLTMLADNPTIYRQEQPCVDFICSVPNTGIDETRVLQGKMGEYIVTARRVGKNWYVGGLTDWNARTVKLDLSFLGEGKYEAVLFSDGVNAGKQAADYKKTEQTVERSSSLQIDLAPGGGFALSLIQK